MTKKTAPIREDGRYALVSLLLALAAVVGLLGYLFLGGYRQSYRLAEISAGNLVAAIASEFEETLARADSNLKGICRQLNRDELAHAGTDARRAQVEAQLADYLVGFPQVVNYRIFNADGDVVYGAGPGRTDFNVADRAWFQTLKQDPGRTLVISGVVFGRGAEMPLATVAIPVREAGAFQGAAIAVLNLDYFQGEVARLDIGEKGTIGVRRIEDGVGLVRRPYVPEQAGQPFRSPVSAMVQRGQDSGEVEFGSPVDGVIRLYAFQRLRNYPLYVAVGLAKDEFLRPWRRQTILVGAAAAILLAALAVLFLRQLKAQTALRAGNRTLIEREAQLEDSEARYRLLIDGVQDYAIFHVSPEGLVDTWNAGAERIKGYAAADIIGQPISCFYPPEAVAAGLPAQALEIARRDGRFEEEGWRQRRDGSRFWAHVEICALRGGDGHLTGFAKIIRDLTERRRQEAQIRELSQLNAKVISESPLGILAFRAAGPCVIANDAAGRIVGGSAASLKALNFRELASWKRCGLLDAAERTLSSGDSQHVSVAGATTFGKQAWLDMDMSAFKSGGDAHLLVIVQDVAEQRRAEAALKSKTRDLELTIADLARSNDDLERFAYVASHDLQTPLRNIASFAQLLDHRYRGRLDADADDFISFIVNGAQHMARLITDLLNFARVTSQGEALVPVRTADLVVEVLANLDTAIGETGAEVSVGPLPEVLADRTQLISLFQNLIGNALKYRHPQRPPRVAVTAQRHSPTHWRIAVADNGIGIEQEYFDKIFEIFQRLTPNDGIGGTGIGLAICQRIVHRLGGDIWLDSVPGQGSIFYFTVRAPAAAAAAAAGDKASAEGAFSGA